MSTKHTQGEWIVAKTQHWENGEQLDICAHIDDGDGHFVTVATVLARGGHFSVGGDDWEYEITPEEAAANAQLLASAPRLLMALRRLTQWGHAIAGSKIKFSGDHPLAIAEQLIAEATRSAG